MTAAAQSEIEPGRVLVVDDSTANLLALSAVLKPLGVHIVEARSGPEAIKHVANNSFAVALLDVQMPHMDGFELATRLREMTPGAELPIIFLTAIHQDELYVKRGYELGGADYVMKPFDANVLRARVKAFVELYQQRERLRAAQVGERTRERDAALAELARLLESERAARREAEIANRAKDEFLATVSHELRTPVNAILGWSMLARDMTREPQVQRALATIERNARAQMRIIDDVLDIGHIMNARLHLEVSDVDIGVPISAALETVRPAADAKGVTVTTTIAQGLGKVRGDPQRLQQVLWNLLTNAIKFTPKGGHVELTAEQTGTEIAVCVRDDGTGIAPDFLPHVFEPFRQADGSTSRRHGGLGLGLAIAKQLVQAHGGTLVAESPGLERGATFVVQLPVHASSAESTNRHSTSSARGALDGMVVLVVDDDEDGRALLEHILASEGASVDLARSAEEALRAMDARAPDVILSDVSMPDIDGMELVRLVRDRGEDRGGRTPAVAVTAHTKGTVGAELFAAGFQAHVGKPIEPAELISVVGATVRGHQNASQRPTS